MSDALLVGTRKGLFEITRDGGGWTVNAPHFLGAPVTMTMTDTRDGAIYAALNHGHFGVKLHRSDDAGANWIECATPAYPQRPADWVVDESKPGSKAPWSTEQIWALEPDGSDEAGALWAGTIPGGVFRSRDRGASWELNRALWDCPERLQWFGGGYDNAGSHSICVDPRDRRRVAVGVSCGGVWISEDDGETWNSRTRGMYAEYMPPEERENPNIQDPHRLVQCRGAPDTYWVQHHNGVFRSTDGATSWSDVPAAAPSSFGFAVAVHPTEPDTAWFVPAIKDECRVPLEGRFVVSRTRDGGESFEILDRGLPGPPCYDIVFRHGLDVDESGQRLAVGSTSGGLWISEDQGDFWTEVPGRLPPVYCVEWQSA